MEFHIWKLGKEANNDQFRKTYEIVIKILIQENLFEIGSQLSRFNTVYIHNTQYRTQPIGTL